MDLPILVFVCCLLAAVGTLQLMGRKPKTTGDTGQKRMLSPLAATLSTPALLVPTVLAAIAAWLAVGVNEWAPLRVSENPFGALGFFLREAGNADNAIVLGAMVLCVAGYVGLLTAWHRKGKANGLDFWQGIKDHTFTFALAKLALCLWISGVSEIVDHRGDGAITLMLYVAPSLLLAPVLGTAALHPRRPIRALKAALERCTWDLHGSGKILFVQILTLLTIWLLFRGDDNEALRTANALAQDSSTLSFNPFPLMSWVRLRPHDQTVGYSLVACSMLFSTVFMHQYYRRVMDVSSRPE